MSLADDERVPGSVGRSAVICALVALCWFGFLAASVSFSTTALSDEVGHVWSIDRDVVRFRKAHDVWFDSPRRLRVLELRDIAQPPHWVALGLAGLAVGMAKRRWAIVGAFGGALAVLPLVDYVIKPLVHRTVQDDFGEAAYAFPSLSVVAVASVAAACVLGFAGRRRVAAALVASLTTIAYAILVAISGSHFLTDCVGSILLGPAAVILGARAGLFAEEFSGRRRLLRRQMSSP